MNSKSGRADSGTADQWRGRRIFLLLVLATILPTIIAGVLYWSGWKPEGRKLSFGELLDPARPLPELALHPAAASVRAFSALRGKWLLLALTDRPCDESCRGTLYAMQQIRLAQGPHMRRVERVLIFDRPGKNEIGSVVGEFPGTHIYISDGRASSVLAKTVHNVNSNVEMQILIVDPNGNLVMRYPSAANASGVSKDLTRLLRLSRVD